MTIDPNGPVGQEASNIDWYWELIRLMGILRGQSGCPWDREQTHESLKRYLVEETAELIEAIEQGDDLHLQEELGDVLLQVIFHAQIASEAGRFDAQSVARGICQKLVRRHPHVFEDKRADSPEQVAVLWDRIKQRERQDPGQTPRTALSGVPSALPALHRAYKVQKLAAKVGFDWPSVAGVFEKIEEEIDEVRRAVASRDDQAVQEELGDLLFAVTNLCRFSGHFPEDLLHAAIRKFERRFECIEQWLAEQDKVPQQCSLEELELLWQKAKGRC